ncbi:MAG: hypothetical protein KDD69_12450, partial [Bdellovibrionales bacterium]|nr:hypothetical protein [Bdellovibrionales bacterium]
HFDADCSAGSFVEGLWHGDVVELFLGDAETGRYREFNLSPTGAWWAAAFAAYRERESAEFTATPLLSSSVKLGHWGYSFRIPRSLLGLDPTERNARVAVSAILGSPRRYFSTGTDPAATPDFHRVELYSLFDFRRPIAITGEKQP